MKTIETDLPGVLIIEPVVHEDGRGFFLESYNYRDYVEAGISDVFVQDNYSRSVRGTLRGLHYQASPGQAKLVRVGIGEVFDVVVDIRSGSATFGRWIGVTLSAESHRMLYVPVGFAHGFCVVSETADFLYKVTSYYAPELERGIAWNDPDIRIDWPVSDPLLSERDRNHPGLIEAPRGH